MCPSCSEVESKDVKVGVMDGHEPHLTFIQKIKFVSHHIPAINICFLLLLILQQWPGAFIYLTGRENQGPHLSPVCVVSKPCSLTHFYYRTHLINFSCLRMCTHLQPLLIRRSNKPTVVHRYNCRKTRFLNQKNTNQLYI